MVLGSSYTKTTGAWTVGSTQGSLDTGTIANNTWYHVFIIQRVDTGVVDILTSTNAASPTMPASYTRKRRIGSLLTNGSAQWVKFTQFGDEFLWDIAINAANTTIGTTSSLQSSVTPVGVQTIAMLQGLVANTLNTAVLFTSPDQADVAAAGVTGNFNAYAAAGVNGGFSVSIRTNTSSQVRVNAANSSTNLQMSCRGWIDYRGRF